MFKKIFIILIPIFIIIIYLIFPNNKLNYISLGDSLALGENPYSNIEYSYSDYLNNYLKQEDKINLYSKALTRKTYTINELQNDIELNKSIIINNKKIGIKRLLREADILTISIGQDDLTNDFKYIKTTDQYIIYNQLNNFIIKINKLITCIKRYNKNNIILITNYNLYLNQLTTLQNKTLNKYLLTKLKNTAKVNNIKYIHISKITNKNYYPNPNNNNPNYKGHYKIYKDLVKIINKKYKIA